MNESEIAALRAEAQQWRASYLTMCDENERLRGENANLREAIARMASNASIPHRVKAIAKEALGE